MNEIPHCTFFSVPMIQGSFEIAPENIFLIPNEYIFISKVNKTKPNRTFNFGEGKNPKEKKYYSCPKDE